MKKKVVRKLMALALVSAMATSMLAGCGSGDDSGKDSGKDADKGSEETVLKVAAFEGGNGTQIWEDIAKAFEESHDGVKVELEMSPELDKDLTKAIQNGDVPDVVYYNLGQPSGFTETMLKEEAIADISDVFDDELKDKMLDGILDGTDAQPYGDGKIYLAPIFYTPTGFWYNATLVGEGKQYEIPTTWDEFFALGEQAKKDGHALFTFPTTGYFDAFFYALLHETMGSEDFTKALNYAEGIWDTDGAKKAFDIVTKLATTVEPTTTANANDNDFRNNQQLVLDDKALFMPNGNWVIGEMADAPRADGFEWGFTALPAVEKDGERASYTFFEQIWMPSSAEHKDLGKEFIAYMYSDAAADIFAKSGAIQPIEGMSDKLDGDNKLYYSIYDTGAVAVMDAFATTDPVEGVTVRTTFFDPVNSLVTGDKTEDDWVNQIKTDSDKLRAALK